MQASRNPAIALSAEIPLNLDEVVLVESATMRAKYLDRIDAIDKVGVLAMLPDGINATTDMVAEYFDVPTDTIASIVKRNRDELESNGFRTLRSSDLHDFKAKFRMHLPSSLLRSSQLALFTRASVLNVGMLLTESSVAQSVRSYLLALDATATAEHKQTAVQLVRLQERMDYQQILHSLKLGGAVSEDYRAVQEALYIRLFGATAARIRATRDQLTGDRLKNGTGFTKASSTVAKNYLTEDELQLLNLTVLGTFIQIQQHYRTGASAAQMIDCVYRAADLTMPKALAA